MPRGVNLRTEVSDDLTDATRSFSHSAGLSDREQEIFALAAHGLVDKEISERLGIAYTTIKSYWSRVCFKLGVSNRQLAIGRLFADLAARDHNLHQSLSKPH